MEGTDNADTVRLLGAWEQVLSALSFYADQESYHAVGFYFDRPCGGFDEDFEEDHGHPYYDRPMPGKQARAALRAWSNAVHNNKEDDK